MRTIRWPLRETILKQHSLYRQAIQMEGFVGVMKGFAGEDFRTINHVLNLAVRRETSFLKDNVYQALEPAPAASVTGR